jgi:predicted dehydrogenase
VPDHKDVILAALDAGKHVYCEWPLGRDVKEAEELAAAAEKAGVVNVIGLQGRMSLAARCAHRTLASGALGELLSAHVVTSTSAWGPESYSHYAYLNQSVSGATLSSILGGHTLDLANYLLGATVNVQAMANICHPDVHIADTGGNLKRDTSDQLDILSRHESGCVLSSAILGNQSQDASFQFEITGAQGKLRILGGDPRGFQAGVLSVDASVPLQPEDNGQSASQLIGPATNVTEVYRAMQSDIRTGSKSVCDFSHATRLTRLIARTLESAEY